MSIAPTNFAAPMPVMGMAPQYAQAQMLPMHAQAGLPMATGMALPLAPAGPVVVTPQMAQAMAAQQAGMPMPAAAAQGMLGAAGTKPPSKIGNIIKNALLFGGLGAAIGAGATLLPFIPGGPLTGALIGGAAGALIGIVKGLRSGSDPAQLNAMQGVPADPNMLGPAVTVRPPAKKKAKSVRRRPSVSKKTHTVRSGDTLAAIAKQHKTEWQKIYKLNRKVIGDNPSQIKVGMKLTVPAKVSTGKD